jgi:hypothetical protein
MESSDILLDTDYLEDISSTEASHLIEQYGGHTSYRSRLYLFLFYSKDCPASRNMLERWTDLVQSVRKKFQHLDLKTGKVDLKDPGIDRVKYEKIIKPINMVPILYIYYKDRKIKREIIEGAIDERNLIGQIQNIISS